ncbi:MAG: tRNA pseudouridine synthase A [Steroidobacteraceae bacterium]
MRRYAACIEYDGAGFAGWQVQPGLRTIEAELRRALESVAAHPVDIICAGRTDAGVHATGQIIHFESSARRSLRGWALGATSELPADVSVRWVRPVPGHFHARLFGADAHLPLPDLLPRRAAAGARQGRLAARVARPRGDEPGRCPVGRRA